MTEMVRSGLVQYHPDLAGLLTPIENLTPHPDNPNNGDVEEICASIETNGMYGPILAQRSTNHILRGNHTYLACQILGATEIPVTYADVDDIHALRILMGDNKIAAMAVRDPAIELANLERLIEQDSLSGTGYSDYDIENLRKLIDTPLHLPDHRDPTTWPVICTQMPPHMRTAYMQMTDSAGGDTERFRLLMRLAGWDDPDDSRE